MEMPSGRLCPCGPNIPSGSPPAQIATAEGYRRQAFIFSDPLNPSANMALREMKISQLREYIRDNNLGVSGQVGVHGSCDEGHGSRTKNDVIRDIQAATRRSASQPSSGTIRPSYSNYSEPVRREEPSFSSQFYYEQERRQEQERQEERYRLQEQRRAEERRQEEMMREEERRQRMEDERRKEERRREERREEERREEERREADRRRQEERRMEERQHEEKMRLLKEQHLHSVQMREKELEAAKRQFEEEKKRKGGIAQVDAVEQSMKSMSIRDESTKHVASLSEEKSRFALLHNIRKLQLSKLKYNPKKVLGEGTFGTVYKGTYMEIPVAIKKLKVVDCARDDFWREAASLSKLRHPNIVQIIGILQEQNLFIMELVEGTNLDAWLRQRKRAKEIDRHTTGQSSRLHPQFGASHDPHDIKSLNVMLDSHENVKLLDFGLSTAKKATQSVTSTGNKGFTLRWAAPEVLDRKLVKSRGTAVDVYAYGMVLLECLTLNHPWADTDYTEDDIREAVKDKERPQIPEQVQQEVCSGECGGVDVPVDSKATDSVLGPYSIEEAHYVPGPADLDVFASAGSTPEELQDPRTTEVLINTVIAAQVKLDSEELRAAKGKLKAPQPGCLKHIAVDGRRALCGIIMKQIQERRRAIAGIKNNSLTSDNVWSESIQKENEMEWSRDIVGLNTLVGEDPSKAVIESIWLTLRECLSPNQSIQKHSAPGHHTLCCAGSAWMLREMPRLVHLVVSVQCTHGDSNRKHLGMDSQLHLDEHNRDVELDEEEVLPLVEMTSVSQRRRIDRATTTRLRSVFSIDKNPTQETIEKLAQESGLATEDVERWFELKRYQETTKKRKRHSYTPLQKVWLEAAFEKQPFPALSTVRELADELKLTIPQVQCWYKNKRMKVGARSGTRHNFSEEEKEILADFFNKRHYPTNEQINWLSEKTHLRKKVVKHVREGGTLCQPEGLKDDEADAT
ncbi:Serine/threonine-protein kinase DCLK3 [Planoprotostelium fungivorum]|uniref:Serine/threonine-protein kinase DCLK3 n=1 Tax=Planoprotostelium fungivorum TaxID=1890364 RepID=A0A2P6N1K5_9EUKA|nr:Serine/threonine-protein kinase DCLK3 [Planoprotostelium fungivorum]